MIRRLLLLATVAVCIHCTESRPPVSTSSQPSADHAAAAASHAEANPSAVPAAAAAQKAAIDPDSGELTSQTAVHETIAPAAVQRSAPETSSETLREQPSPVPGGGMMIDLKGRFRNPVSATVGGDDGTPAEPTAAPRDGVDP